MSTFGPEYRPKLTTESDELPRRLLSYDVLGTPVLEPDFDFEGPYDADEDSQENALFEVNVAKAFEDIVMGRYIETRSERGIHCMDYDMAAPGVQLPGGLTETYIFCRFISQKPEDALPLRQAYPATLQEIPTTISWHHNQCAAARFKREALRENSVRFNDTREFTLQVLDALGLLTDRTEGEVEQAIWIGAERADNPVFWNIDATREEGTKLARELGAPYETLIKTGKSVPAGLRIDATPYLFNSKLFRQEHTTEDGTELGVYNVSLGALRDAYRRVGVKDRAITRIIMGATLFTHGLAMHLGGEYLRAAIVLDPHNTRSNE